MGKFNIKFIFLLFVLSFQPSYASNLNTIHNHIHLDHTDLKIKMGDLTQIDKFINQLAADGGGWSGNGGGSKKNESDNIWFIGDQDVNFCILREKSFPLDEATILSMVKTSIQKWTNFFDNYGILNNKLAGGYSRQVLNNLTFKDGINRGLSQNFFYQKDCSNVRLQFLFGLENKVITEYKKFAENHPYGLAIREKYDHKTFAHKGMIWIDNFSSDQKEIEHIVLHELGHIFGMAHDSVPVMDERLTSFVGKKKTHSSEFLGKIESDSWTYGLKEGREIIMSSTRGMKRRMHNRNRGRNNQQAFCQDLKYSHNRTLPKEIRNALGLNQRGCHKISVTYEGQPNQPLGRRARGRRNNKLQKDFTFVMEDKSQSFKWELKGSFKGSKGQRASFIGPSIVTNALNFNSQQRPKRFVGHSKRLTLEKELNVQSLTGVFQGSLNSYPAKITFNKGMVIEIFLPQLNKWWTLRTQYNSN